MTVNRRLWALFDSGYALEVLAGQGEYFVEERAYGGHNVSLVLSQLCNWAVARGRVDEASVAFCAVLRGHVAACRADDAFALVWTFIVLSRHLEMPFALDVPEVAALLDDAATAANAHEAIARFEGSMTKVAKVRSLLATSDGRHFDLEPWRPPGQPSP